MHKLWLLGAALIALAAASAYPTVVVQSTSVLPISQAAYTQDGYNSYAYYGTASVYQPVYSYPSEQYNNQAFQDGYRSGYNDGYRDGRNGRIAQQYPYTARVYACIGCVSSAPVVVPYYDGYSTVPVVVY